MRTDLQRNMPLKAAQIRRSKRQSKKTLSFTIIMCAGIKEEEQDMSEYYLAVDIGASSGRHIVGWLENGIMFYT